MSGNLEEKTEEGDSKEAKFVSFGSHAWTRGPQIVTYSQESLGLIFPNPRCQWLS